MEEVLTSPQATTAFLVLFSIDYKIMFPSSL